MKKKITVEKKAEESKELIVAKKTVPAIITAASDVEIVDEAAKAYATELLSNLNTWNDRVVADRETLTVPLNALLKNIRARYSPVETMLKSAIEGLRGKLGRYQTEQTNKAREEAARIAARVGDGKGKLQFETAARKMEAIEKPVEKVETDAGTLRFREDKVLKVVELGKIPFEYFDLNEGRALAALKEGKVVPGCEIELVQTPINNRR